MGKEMAEELIQLITKYFLPTCNNVVTRIFFILEFVLLRLFFKQNVISRLFQTSTEQHSFKENLYRYVVKSKDGSDQQKLCFDAFKGKSFFNFQSSG